MEGDLEQSREIASLLSDVAAQNEHMSALASRHALEVHSLKSRQASEAAELRTHQAQEQQTAQKRALELKQKLAAALMTQQHHLQQVDA